MNPEDSKSKTTGRLKSSISSSTTELGIKNDRFEVVEEPMIDLSQMPPLKSLKPGEISDPQLKITPAREKFSPKYPTIKTRDGSSTADEIGAQREERDLIL
jgi:hypothetical protein